MTRAEIAQARLKAASEHVEAAQHELERAISALGALKWMHPEQLKIETLRDRIHEAFYRLAPISHARAKACAKAELDREPETGDEDPHKGCCAGTLSKSELAAVRAMSRTPVRVPICNQERIAREDAEDLS